MVFQLNSKDGRAEQYPNAQDINFLGFDREADRWKVDASGINYKRISGGVTTSAATISKFIDFMGLSNATISGQGGNATSTWIAVNVQFNEEVVLKAEDEDKMTLTINDDLSGLLYLRVGAGAKVETRE